MGYKDGDEVEDRDLATRISSFFGVEDIPQDILSWFEDNTKDIVPKSEFNFKAIREAITRGARQQDKADGIFDKPDKLSYDPYSGYFGINTIVSKEIFTPTENIPEMTLSTVLENQANMIASIQAYNKKNPTNRQFESAAFGAYQLMPKTLEGLIDDEHLNLDSSKTIFTPEIQDMLAKELLREANVYNYIADPTNPSSNLSTIQNKLAHIWRSLPNTKEVSASKEQNIGIEYQEFRDILKRVQELGPEKGVKLLLRTIIMAEHAPRKNN
jgi:hypothetical protein